MKKDIFFIIILFAVIIQLEILTDNRERLMSSAEMEEEARMGVTDEAQLTTQQKEQELLGNVDSAYFTQKEEEQARLGNINYASETQKAEEVARY